MRPITIAFILVFLQPAWAVGDDSKIQIIDNKVEKIKVYEKSHKDHLKTFQVMEKGDGVTLTQVAKPVNEESEATYYILKDDSGKILYHKKVPTSLSGDWYSNIIYYFDEKGRTYLYKYHLSEFNNMCSNTGATRIDSSFYFDSDFKLIRKLEVFSDADYNPISVEGCNIKIKNHKIAKNWNELSKMNDVELEQFAKERKFLDCMDKLKPKVRFSKNGIRICRPFLD